MTAINQAIILAAGLGSRLGPLGEHSPKCLTPVGGRPLLETTLESLLAVGINDLVFVIGHCGAEIRQQLGTSITRFISGSPVSASIRYVEAVDYERTNNLVSLWASRKMIKPPFLLVEADVMISRSALTQLVEAGPSALAVAARPIDDVGTHVVLDHDNRVIEMRIDHAPNSASPTKGRCRKTINITKVSTALWSRHFEPALARFIVDERLGEFYEAALAEEVVRGGARLQAVEIERSDWLEVDTPADLERAGRVALHCAAQGSSPQARSRATTNSSQHSFPNQKNQ